MRTSRCCGRRDGNGSSTVSPSMRLDSSPLLKPMKASKVFVFSRPPDASIGAVRYVRTFPSPSELFARLEPRERRVVLGGAALSAASLVLVLGVLPLSSRWSAREESIAAKRQQLSRLTALVGSASSV